MPSLGWSNIIIGRGVQNLLTRYSQIFNAGHGLKNKLFLLFCQPNHRQAADRTLGKGPSNIISVAKLSTIILDFGGKYRCAKIRHPTCVSRQQQSLSFSGKADELKEEGGGYNNAFLRPPSSLHHRPAADCLQSVLQSSWGTSLYDVHKERRVGG